MGFLSNFFKKIKNIFVKEIVEIRVIDLRKGKIVNLNDLEKFSFYGNVLDQNKRKITTIGVTYFVSFPESWVDLVDKNGDYIETRLVQLENGKRIIVVGGI